MQHLLGFREVIPDQTIPEKWQEIKLNTGKLFDCTVLYCIFKHAINFTDKSLILGGTQSTLQDIKMTERAGGYAFKDTSKSYTRNRFIYW